MARYLGKGWGANFTKIKLRNVPTSHVEQFIQKILQCYVVEPLKWWILGSEVEIFCS